MKTVRGFMLIWAGLPLAAAAQETLRLAPTQIEMPRRIGPLYLQGQPHKFDPPELGVAYQYNGNGLSLTAYVYDAGIADIPDGGDSVAACQQFEQAKQDIAGAGYANTVLRSEQLARLAPPEVSPLAREAVFEFERDGNLTISYLWVTAVNRNFVKLRFSLDARLREEVPEARRTILTTLGTAMKPQLQPAAPAPADDPKEGAKTQIIMGTTALDDMATGFLYLMLLSGAVEASPEILPVCGGPLIPTYETELAAYRGVVSMESEDEKSRLAGRLAAVEAAGFLEEFVWTELHRVEWGDAPPAGLALDEYRPWRKKHLKRFKPPNFGMVSLERPKPMPLEPAEVP